MKKKLAVILTIVIMVVLVVVVYANVLIYQKKIKKMFVQSSVTAMEDRIEEEADFTNKNVEVNYEEIRLLAGMITKYLDGTDQYSENVLEIMSETKKQAGYDQIGILKVDDERPFATTSDGRLVQLDVWVLDLSIESGKVEIELQTSPFRTVDEGNDAVVYRYIFSDNTGAEYMLIAEKSQETLNTILNVNNDGSGLTLVMRDNGNIIFGKGRVGSEEISSYNFWAYLSKLGASTKLISDEKQNLKENNSGKFELNIDGEPYHFIYRNIENTNWISVNAYSETYLAGSDLKKVSNETMKLVMIVALALMAVLIFTAVLVVQNIKNKGEEKILEREKLFEEMSRHIPQAFAILTEGETTPSFVSHNFYSVLHNTIENCSVDNVIEWIGCENADEQISEFYKTGKFKANVDKIDRSFSIGVYDIGYVGNERHFVMIFDDITEENNSRKLLEDSMKKAAAASESKTGFLSKMSHEIRTPLNAIIGFSKLTIDGWNTTDNAELFDYICKIQGAGNYLLELVSDILDISRIEEGRMSVSYAEINLNQMIDEVTSAFEGQMKRKDIQFVVDKNFEDVILKIDQIHTRQILNNLISNACKYTDEGGCVGLEVTTGKINEKQMSVQFVVQDTGIGMSEAFLKKIFEPFTQDERGMLMKNQLRGSGLGMSICKNLVELLNGDIKVESVLGEGTVFTVTLIFDIVEEIEEKNSIQSIDVKDYKFIKNKRILVVDDIETNVIVIEKLLEKYGPIFENASNGQEAVEKYEKSSEGEYFAIFMDVNMPVMNGYEASEAIRKTNRSDSGIAIVAMTADALSDDVNKAYMSGMNYHITKPVDVEKVLQVLMEINHKEENCHEK